LNAEEREEERREEEEGEEWKQKQQPETVHVCVVVLKPKGEQ
jgi:hypothetical protein